MGIESGELMASISRSITGTCRVLVTQRDFHLISKQC